MTVTVELPTMLRRFARGEVRVAVEAESVAASLHGLVDRYPDLRPQLLAASGKVFGFVGVFLNDADVRCEPLETVRVAPGDVITLVSAVAGG